jgi:Flp pilus assembly protein CpaB
MKSGYRDPRLARSFAVVALIAGAIAAWMVSDYAGSLKRQSGPPVQVYVAAAPIARGERVGADITGAGISLRTVPSAFAPVDAVTSIDQIAGSRAVAEIAAGSYLTKPLFDLASARGAGYRLRHGERALTVEAKAAPEGATFEPGASVDLFASGIGGGSNTTLLLAAAEVLAANQSESAAGSWQITLRIDSGQAARLIEGDVFAKELRALLLP